jgi:hypothetical protein
MLNYSIFCLVTLSCNCLTAVKIENQAPYPCLLSNITLNLNANLIPEKTNMVKNSHFILPAGKNLDYDIKTVTISSCSHSYTLTSLDHTIKIIVTDSEGKLCITGYRHN